MAKLWAAWERFWFAPVHASSVGVMRASLGLILLVNHIHLWFFIDPLFLPDGPTPARSSGVALSSVRFTYREAFGADGQYAVHAVEIVVFLLLMLGWRSRLMAWLALIIQVSIYHRNPWMQNGGDRVMRFATLYLALVPCGAAFSLDALRESAKDVSTRLAGRVPILAHRLLQIQLIVIYMQSGWEKAKGSSWWDGSAVYDAMSVGGYQRWPEASELLLSSPVTQLVFRLGTWITLFWELGFGLLILWRPTRILALCIGVIVHGGIFSSLMVGAFSGIMIWTYQAWLPPDWPVWLQQRWRRRFRG